MSDELKKEAQDLERKKRAPADSDDDDVNLTAKKKKGKYEAIADDSDDEFGSVLDGTQDEPDSSDRRMIAMRKLRRLMEEEEAKDLLAKKNKKKEEEGEDDRPKESTEKKMEEDEKKPASSDGDEDNDVVYMGHKAAKNGKWRPIVVNLNDTWSVEARSVASPRFEGGTFDVACIVRNPKKENHKTGKPFRQNIPKRLIADHIQALEKIESGLPPPSKVTTKNLKVDGKDNASETTEYK